MRDAILAFVDMTGLTEELPITNLVVVKVGDLRWHFVHGVPMLLIQAVPPILHEFP